MTPHHLPQQVSQASQKCLFEMHVQVLQCIVAHTWHTAHSCCRMGKLDPSQRTKSCAASWRRIIECTRRATAGTAHDYKQGCFVAQPCWWSSNTSVTGASPCAANEMLPAGDATLSLLSEMKAAHPVVSVSRVPGVCNYALQYLHVHPSHGFLDSTTDLLWQMMCHHALLI